MKPNWRIYSNKKINFWKEKLLQKLAFALIQIAFILLLTFLGAKLKVSSWYFRTSNFSVNRSFSNFGCKFYLFIASILNLTRLSVYRLYFSRVCKSIVNNTKTCILHPSFEEENGVLWLSGIWFHIDLKCQFWFKRTTQCFEDQLL